MLFPADSLDLVVEAYLAGDWRDLSDRLIGNQPATITRGKQSGASQVSAGSCRLILDDTDGSLTPLNPLGAWYPYVRRGVPFRVAVRRGLDHFGRTVSSGWGTADSGQAWTASGGSAADFSVSSGAGRHSHGTVNVLRRTVASTSLVDCEQVYDVSTPAALTGGALVTGALARYQDASNYYWLRCEFDQGSSDVILKISKRVGGVDTQLAVLDPVPGLSYAAGVPLRVRAAVAGSRLAVKVWPPSGPEPATWQLTAADASITTPGQAGIQTWLVAGNTNTLPVVVSFDNYQLLVARFAGDAASYRPRLVPTSDGTPVNTAQIELGGVLRRAGRGTPPVRSPMRRQFGAETDRLLAYWTLEDPPDSTQGASVLQAVPAMTPAGTVGFGEGPVSTSPGGSRRYGSMPLANLVDGGSLTGTVPAGTSSPVAWAIQLFYAGPSNIDDNVTQMRWALTGGTYVRWDLVQDVGGVFGMYLRGYDAGGTPTTLWSDATTFGGPAELVISAAQNGANIAIEVRFSDSYVSTASVVGATLGRITTLGLNPDLVDFTDGETFIVGHVRVWDRANVVPHPQTQVRANLGELATVRLARLCAEDGIDIDIPAVDAADEMAMGSQPDGTPLDLYHESEAADGGVLSESAADVRLQYLPRAYRYNQTPTLVVDLSTYQTTAGTSEQVLAPVYDDQPLRNAVEVTRRDGSSAIAVDQDSIAANGLYQDSFEVNLADDWPLSNIASWAVHVAAVDETRTPGLPLDLAANPGLIDQWLSTDIGDRVQRTNSPEPVPGVIDQVLDGYTETLSARKWGVTANCSPYQPWDVAEADGDQRVAADGSTVGSGGLALGGTSFALTSTAANGIWTTDAADFPLDVNVGGEQITLSAISGSTSPQTATISARGVNGVTRAHAAGTAVDMWRPAIASL